MKEFTEMPVSVLIESDWNLKSDESKSVCAIFWVLIESDWNLKYLSLSRCFKQSGGINRIRLEFKGKSTSYSKK